MNLTPVSLSLAVSTAWAAIFLGALRAPVLRFYPRAMLGISAAWILVAFTAPSQIFHWYLILAFIVLVAWVHIRRERFLAGKVWLSLAAGLGISIGVIFYLQSAPAFFLPTLPPRVALLLLASLYLGGGATGAAWAGSALRLDPDNLLSVRRYAGLLFVLALAWLSVAGLELRSPLGLRELAPGPLLHLDFRFLLMPLALLVALSILLIPAARSITPKRAAPLFAITAILAFATQVFARLLLL